MDISLNTIEYLMSNSVYKKINENKEELDKNNKHFINDLKFYKKRIYLTTKLIIKHHIENQEFNRELDGILKDYLVKLIDHFKMEDQTELLQNEFSDIKKKVSFNMINEDEFFNADEFIMKQPELKKNTIENCMNVTVKNRKNEEPIIPRSKKINIKQHEFKIKGLKKHKK